MENFGSYLGSSDNQFGFKQKIGCPHAIYCLRSIIEHSLDGNNTANLCSLDVAKAFDRVNHNVLFTKLMNRLLPVNVITILLNWYRNSASVVNWNGFLSGAFNLKAGVRQGGVLSPALFSVYIDDLILSLKKQGFGCYVGKLCLAVLMYADDLILISCSVTKLQQMINLCIDEFRNIDLFINVKKSECIRIGRRFNNDCANLNVGDAPLAWSKGLTYLGITISSSVKFSIDLKRSRSNFYRSFNSLYSKISKASECVIISLINSFCVPIAMYGLEAIDLNNSELKGLDSVLYNALGKVFSTFDHKTLNWCLHYFNFWPLRYEYINRKFNFLFKLSFIENSLINTAFYLNRSSYAQLCSHLSVKVSGGAKHCNVKKNVRLLFAHVLV